MSNYLQAEFSCSFFWSSPIKCTVELKLDSPLQLSCRKADCSGIFKARNEETVVLLGDIYTYFMQLEMKGKILCIMDDGRLARLFQGFDYASLPVNYGYF